MGDREIWDCSRVYSWFLFQKLQPLCPGCSLHTHSLSQAPEWISCHGMGIPAGNDAPVCQGLVGIPFPSTSWHLGTSTLISLPSKAWSCWASSSPWPKRTWDGKTQNLQGNPWSKDKGSKGRDCPVTPGLLLLLFCLTAPLVMSLSQDLLSSCDSFRNTTAGQHSSSTTTIQSCLG